MRYSFLQGHHGRLLELEKPFSTLALRPLPSASPWAFGDLSLELDCFLNLPLPLDRSLGDDLRRCPFLRTLILPVTQRATSIACRYLVQFLDGL